MSRRSYGSGSLSERSPGVFRLRVYIGKDPKTGNPRQVDRTFRGSRRDAQRALAALVHEVQEGRHRGGNATFGVLLDAWDATLELTRSANTADTYRNHVRVRIRPALGDVKLRALTAADLDAFYARLADEGLAVGTIQLNHAIISGALAQGVKWGWLRESPARSASPPTERKVERETLPVADVLELVRAVESDDVDMATLMWIAVITGARRGELIGLRWSDVDWDDQSIRIARSLVPAQHGGHREGPPKGGRARTVALGAPGVAVLALYREIQTERFGSAPDGPLLSYDGQRPMRAKAVSDYFTALSRRLGVKANLHELRHFHASELMRNNVDPMAVRDRMGHSSIAITDQYSHGSSAGDRAAAAAIGRALGLDAGA